jgi:chaperone required for assembly of F1-ATPase
VAWTVAKRFYGEVGVGRSGTGFTVTLDGRPLQSPAGTAFILPAKELAQAIAAEWRDQEEEIRFHTMPLTVLAGAAIDRTGKERRDVIDHALEYAGADLLCYRAEAPSELVLRQQARWQPLLDWLADAYGARLAVTAGIAHVDQPKPALLSLRAAVEALDDFELAVLSSATAACGSLVLGLALTAGRIDAEAAFDVSQLDETFQSEKWGEDAEAAERRRRLKADIEAAAAFLKLAWGQKRRI